jgi:hypothetical protein
MGENRPDASNEQPEFSISTRRGFLTTTFGVAAAAGTVPLLSSTAVAHFPLTLDIDIQPENADNFIDMEAHESVPVAVHPSEFLDGDRERQTFDPTEESVTYRFGSRFAVQDGDGARPVTDEVREVEDHDGNGHDALLLEFPVEDTGFDGDEETGWLYWERELNGDHGYAGVDSVRIYGSTPSTQTLAELLRQFMA